MILFSVAHSMKSKGASNAKYHISEYNISKLASQAAHDVIADFGHPVAVYDAGLVDDHTYSRTKVDMVNACMPKLAVEIHLNASVDEKANYGEVIHHPNSDIGKQAAESIAESMASALGYTRHVWPMHGARPRGDAETLFFIDHTKAPCVIVEGMFISNDEQAAWIASPQAPETYGLLVANGIIEWLKKGTST